jgi:monofunctional biosynthetic peptidoglycan transglycosylase
MKIIPALLLALTLPHTAQLSGQEAPAAPAPATAAAATPFIIEFAADATEPSWIAVNDGVMGGLSTGGPRLDNGLLHFTGTLSLENNGGFSSIRTKTLDQDFSAATHLVLRVKGDGRDYQLRLATDARLQGAKVSYRANFATTADTWINVKIPLASLSPTYRGTTLQGPPVNLSQIEEIGLLIGDKREGNFALAVDWIKTE